jgi:hypothetical protein
MDMALVDVEGASFVFFVVVALYRRGVAHAGHAAL